MNEEAVSARLMLLPPAHASAADRSPDVALMGAFTSLSIIASLGQQLNTIINWDDIKIAQWQNVKDNRSEERRVGKECPV